MDDITIRINSRTVERIIWIIVVIVLIVGMVYMYFSGFGCDGKEAEPIVDEAEDTVVQEDQEIEEDTEAGEDTEVQEQQEEEEEQEPEQEEAPADNVSVAPSGQVLFTVDMPVRVTSTMLLRQDTQYEVRGKDFAKLTAIYFEIDNNKRSFVPKIDVYVYDSSDNKEDYKETLTFTNTIAKGTIFKKVEGVNIGFDDLNNTKTFEVVLMNEYDEQIAKYKKVMSFE